MKNLPGGGVSPPGPQWPQSLLHPRSKFLSCGMQIFALETWKKYLAGVGGGVSVHPWGRVWKGVWGSGALEASPMVALEPPEPWD